MKQTFFLIFILFVKICYSQENTPLRGVDIVGTFIGGHERLVEILKYTQESKVKEYNINCDSLKKKIVYVGFVIDTLGNSGNFTVLRGINSFLDSIAMNSIADLKLKWTPSYIRLEKVPVSYQLPFRYCMENETDLKVNKRRRRKNAP
jgi:hypothetical protein